MTALTYVAGTTHGVYTILERLEERDYKNYKKYKVKCVCGNTKILSHYAFRNNLKCNCNKISASIYSSKIIGEKVSNIKKSANQRKIDFALPKDLLETILISDCFYCGVSPDGVHGIDRYDSSIGYLPTNVLPCCTICNVMKNSLSHLEFLAHIDRIREHQSAKSMVLLTDHSTAQAYKEWLWQQIQSDNSVVTTALLELGKHLLANKDWALNPYPPHHQDVLRSCVLWLVQQAKI